MLASKGIFAKLLYARGLHFDTVVATRALIAIPGFALMAWWRAGPQPLARVPWRDLTRAALAGFVCYTVGASLNFFALTRIDASVERALLYTYPAMVVLTAWALGRERPGPIMSLSVVGTFVGVLLVVGAWGGGAGTQDLLGVVCVLLCAATIVYYYLASGPLTRSMGSAQFTVVAMTAAGVALGIHYQIKHGWQHVVLDAQSARLMLWIVILATVLPLVAVAEGLRRIGPQRAAIASTSGPPASGSIRYSAIMAAVWLNETVRWWQWLGIALIAGSIALLEIRRARRG